MSEKNGTNGHKTLVRYTISTTEERHYEFYGSAADLQKHLKYIKKNKIRSIIPKGRMINGPILIDNKVSHVAEFDLETGNVYRDA